jgi:uncharacterized membrane protein
MTREATIRFLTGLSAAAFLLSAALLVSSYRSIVASAQQAPADIATLVPALWLAFTAAMIVFGVIVTATTRRDGLNPRLTLFLVALFPTATGICFVRFLGFMSVTVILFIVAGLTLAAAAMRRSQVADPSVAAA